MCEHLLDTPKTPERERKELQAGAQDNRKLCEENCLEIRVGTLETLSAAASREFSSDTPKPSQSASTQSYNNWKFFPKQDAAACAAAACAAAAATAVLLCCCCK